MDKIQEQFDTSILKQKANKIIVILAIAIFGVITTEFGLIGALQLIAQNFNVSLPQTGMLLSIYAIIVAVCGPFITLIFAQYNQKIVLSVSVGIFFVSTLLSTFATSFEIMILSRILAAIVHTLVWSLALSIAVECFPPEKKVKAISYVTLGFITASVVGIPLASYLSSAFSWRMGFALCAFSNFIAFITIVLFLPTIPAKAKISFKSQLIILKKPLVWLNIFLSSAIFAAVFAVYGYFAPYFSTLTHMSANTVSIMLVVYGALGIFGNILFGKITNLNNLAKVLLSVIFIFLIIYNTINLFNYNLIAMIILISLWGIAAAATGVVVQVWCTMNGQEAPAFINSLYVAFANLGITMGTFSGAMGIKYFGINSITTIATIFLAIALILYYITIRVMKRDKV